MSLLFGLITTVTVDFLGRGSCGIFGGNFCPFHWGKFLVTYLLYILLFVLIIYAGVGVRYLRIKLFGPIKSGLPTSNTKSKSISPRYAVIVLGLSLIAALVFEYVTRSSLGYHRMQPGFVLLMFLFFILVTIAGSILAYYITLRKT
jgi:hypothetical protein